VKKASKWTSILHAHPNFPFKPLFLEALQIPLQTQASPFFSYFSFLFLPTPSPSGTYPAAICPPTCPKSLVVRHRPRPVFGEEVAEQEASSGEQHRPWTHAPRCSPLMSPTSSSSSRTWQRQGEAAAGCGGRGEVGARCRCGPRGGREKVAGVVVFACAVSVVVDAAGDQGMSPVSDPCAVTPRPMPRARPPLLLRCCQPGLALGGLTGIHTRGRVAPQRREVRVALGQEQDRVVTLRFFDDPRTTRSRSTRPSATRRVTASRIHRVTAAPVLTVKFRQPSHEFTFGVGMTFVSYPLVLTPVV
jgi:hypothetical protein